MQHPRTRRFTRSLLLCALAGACALPLLPAQALGGDGGATSMLVTRTNDGGEPYGFMRGKGNIMSGDRVDVERIKALSRRVDGPFVWFRSGGTEYIVQDAAILVRVQAAWAPVEAVGAEMGVQGAEMGRHGASMGSIGADMALAAITFNREKMEAAGKRMEEAGKPMEEAGKKMEVLGKKMEQAKEGADREARGAIRDALARGLAKPAPRG